MKGIKRFCISIFSILFVALQAQPTVPVPQLMKRFNCTLPDGYPNKGVDGRNMVNGTVYVYSNDASGKIKKPIIIPEAFDPEDVRGWDSLYLRMNASGLMECLRSAGYDFIVINYDEGGNFIEHNAYLVTQVINWVNDTKITPQKNIVVGPSMGGLVGRYALAYMEHRSINHDTRLFISFDSPQLGANVPLGLQYMVRYWNDRAKGEDATKKYTILKTKGARQMLLYHIQNSLETGFIGPDPLRITFLQNLNAIGGWPEKLRKVAISNGSGHGLLQFKDDNVTRLQPGDKIFDFDEGAAIFSRVWAVPDGDRQKIARCKTFFDANPDDYTVEGTRPYDNMPGGFRPFGSEVKSIDNVGDADKQCFIPTFSALAINTNVNYYSPADDPAVMSKTPFDAIYYPVENQGHVVVTAQNKNWILKEIMPANLEVSTTFLDKPAVADIQASKQINLRSGFSTKNGPDFYIHIDPFPVCNNAAAPMAEEEPSNQTTTGIFVQHDEESSAIRLYPNPASDLVTVDAKGKMMQELQLFYADGRLIASIKPLQSVHTLSLADLHNGIYFIKIACENETTIKRLIRSQ